MGDERKKDDTNKNKEMTTETDWIQRCWFGQGPGAKFTLTGALSPDSMEAPKHDLFNNEDKES